MIQRSVDGVVDAYRAIDWSICIRDAVGNELAGHHADRSMRTASVGKLLLLIEVARQCGADDSVGATMLGRDPELQVADSGIWQHLRTDALAVHDLCVLIASVSDNLATNILLKYVGLQRVRALAESLGLMQTALLDRVRDHRGPDDPATLSVGSAAELSGVMHRLSRGQLVSAAVSDQVNAWLATGVDLSMVPSAIGLDPLAHAPSDRNIMIRNKTGTDPGVRADVGVIGRGSVQFAYAVIANWDPAGPDLRDAALSGMRDIGAMLRGALGSATG